MLNKKDTIKEVLNMSLEDFKKRIKRSLNMETIPNFNEYITSKFEKDTQLWESGLKEIVEEECFLNTQILYYYARDLIKEGITESDWSFLSMVGLICSDKEGNFSLFYETQKLIPDELIVETKNNELGSNEKKGSSLDVKGKGLASVYVMRQTLLDDRLMQPLVEWSKTIERTADDFNWNDHRYELQELLVENGYLDIVKEIANEMIEHKVLFNR